MKNEGISRINLKTSMRISDTNERLGKLSLNETLQNNKTRKILMLQCFDKIKQFFAKNK